VGPVPIGPVQPVSPVAPLYRVTTIGGSCILIIDEAFTLCPQVSWCDTLHDLIIVSILLRCVTSLDDILLYTI
jgi:hypothetical protein